MENTMGTSGRESRDDGWLVILVFFIGFVISVCYMVFDLIWGSPKDPNTNKAVIMYCSIFGAVAFFLLWQYRGQKKDVPICDIKVGDHIGKAGNRMEKLDAGSTAGYKVVYVGKHGNPYCTYFVTEFFTTIRKGFVVDTETGVLIEEILQPSMPRS